MNSHIFLPLRSNAAWFISQESRSRLERLIKTYILLYDQIILQNGRYMCTIGDRGSFDFIAPSTLGIVDRSKIKYFQPGQKFRLLVGLSGTEPRDEVLGGEVRASYEVDYYPIIKDAGLLEVEYVKWLNADINDDDKKLAKDELRKDSQRPNNFDQLPGNHFQRKKILESLYLDSIFAYRVGLPFMVDYHTRPIIDWKNDSARIQWGKSLPEMAYRLWVSLGLPDYENASWEELHKMRESAIGADFRRMIKRISNSVSSAASDLGDERELAELGRVNTN